MNKSYLYKQSLGNGLEFKCQILELIIYQANTQDLRDTSMQFCSTIQIVKFHLKNLSGSSIYLLFEKDKSNRN